MKMCMVNAHGSRLKDDEVNIKGLPASHRVCPRCDLYALENIHHMVMQCTGYHDLLRLQMYEEIRNT